MKLTDPIADMFTRIRNALQENHEEVTVPYSKIKLSILELFKNYGFINSFKVYDNKGKSQIVINLKYDSNGKSIISVIKRVSKPGKRIYVKKASVPKVRSGFGLSIINSSKGVLDGKAARLSNVGGELIGIVFRSY